MTARAKNRGETWTILASLPLKTTNPLNGSHGHWSVASKARKLQRASVGAVTRARMAARGMRPWEPETRERAWVTLTRIAPSSGLDDDNLRAALKAVRDGVADAMGINDRDPRVLWIYDQRREKPREYAVEILIQAWRTDE